MLVTLHTFLVKGSFTQGVPLGISTTGPLLFGGERFPGPMSVERAPYYVTYPMMHVMHLTTPLWTHRRL